jgi:hypothetical protein
MERGPTSKVRPRCPRDRLPGGQDPAPAAGSPVHHLEPVQAGGTPARRPADRHQHRDGARDPARCRYQLAGHQDLEDQPRPGLHAEDDPDPRPLRQPTRGWAGDLRRRVRPAEPDASPGPGLVPQGPTGSTTGDPHPHRRGAHMFGALDLASGQMFHRFRDRKRWQEFLAFLKQLRTRFPAGRLYVVCENFLAMSTRSGPGLLLGRGPTCWGLALGSSPRFWPHPLLR